MSRITFVVPTHDHGELLGYSVRSVLAQTIDDLDVVVLGDGVDDLTRSVARGLADADGRVRFLDLPKAPRLGETHRHELLTSTGVAPVICYVSDDDLLLPFHAELVLGALSEADFVSPMATWIRTDGRVAYEPTDLRRDDSRRWIVTGPRTTFGLTGTAHTHSSYRRLPHGWRTTPLGQGTDHHMWVQFLEQPWLRATTLDVPSILQFPSPPRRSWSPGERIAELERWVSAANDDGFVDAHRADVRAGMVEAAVNHMIRERWWELSAEHQSALKSDAETWTVELRSVLDATVAELVAAERRLDHELRLRTELENRRDADAVTIGELQSALDRSTGELRSTLETVEALRGHLERVKAAELRLDEELRAIVSTRSWRLRSRLVSVLPTSRAGGR